MTTLQQVIEAALNLPSEEQDALIAAIGERKRSKLVTYARQAALDVKAGKLQTRSVAEIMSYVDEPDNEVTQ
jgi:glycosyltransferase A (GT-A) superfamily protein (DUF2064 family)